MGRTKLTQIIPLFLFGLLVVGSIGNQAIAEKSRRVESSPKILVRGKTMGTTFSVTIEAKKESDLPEQKLIQKKIQQRLSAINQSMSTYIDDSEISRFNQSDSTEWFSVKPDFAKVVQRSIEISKLTEGAFDVTVGPLVNQWGFGKTKRDSDTPIPTKEEIDKILLQVGFDNLTVRLDPPAIKKSIPELKIDLSAVAKGYAVDQICELVISESAEFYFVEIGGEVRTSSSKADGKGWRVGIERPQTGIQEIGAIAKLQGQSMATSGNYRNYFESGGKFYSHTIDPRTGFPTDHSVLSASVIAEDCMTADALATAMMVLGPDQGKALVESESSRVVSFIFLDDKKNVQSSSSENFPLVEEEAAKSQGNPLMVFVAGLAIFLIAVLGMAAGAIVNKRPIQGSCGGLANMNGTESPCDLCSNKGDCKDAVLSDEGKAKDPSSEPAGHC